MEEVAAVVDHQNHINTKISKLSISEGEEETLNFLDSLDHYLILIDSLSNTLLRQGWLELAGARYSMGASRVNTALLNLQPHSAATTVEITHDDDGNKESSPESSIESVTNASPSESNGSEINASPHKTENPVSDEETLINFLDSLDHYLILIDSLSNTLLRQGWLELAGARYSMGASRVNTALLNLQPHSAATTVEITHDQDGSLTKSPKFNLCKWASPDNKDSSLEKENMEEDEQLKDNISSQRDSGNQESSPDSSIESVTNASPRESIGSEINASPRKIENPEQSLVFNQQLKNDDLRTSERTSKGTINVWDFGSPKLRASQLTFETALETLIEIANARSSILKSYEALHRDMKSTKE